MKKTLLLLAAVTSLVASPAFAAPLNEGAKDFYVRVDGGTTFRNSISHSLGNRTDFTHTMKTKKSTGVFSVGGGMYLPFNFRADLTYNQYLTMKRIVSLNDIVSGNYIYRLSSYNVMLTGYYNIPTATGLTPYVLAGVGYGQNNLKSINYALTGLSNLQGYITGKTVGSFVYSLGVGTSYSFSHNFALDISYRYTDLGKVISGSQDVTNLGTFSYIPEKGHVRTQSVMAGLRFSF